MASYSFRFVHRLWILFPQVTAMKPRTADAIIYSIPQVTHRFAAFLHKPPTGSPQWSRGPTGDLGVGAAGSRPACARVAHAGFLHHRTAAPIRPGRTLPSLRCPGGRLAGTPAPGTSPAKAPECDLPCS